MTAPKWPRGPLKPAPRSATELLESHRRKFVAGNRGILPIAMAVCAYARIPMPDWLASAWLAARDAVFHGAVRSWDDVLRNADETPRTEGQRKRWQRDVRVLDGLLTLLPTLLDAAIDDDFFVVIAGRLGTTPSKARRLYYEVAPERRLSPIKPRKPPPGSRSQKKGKK